jgi:hypothetical protein
MRSSSLILDSLLNRCLITHQLLPFSLKEKGIILMETLMSGVSSGVAHLNSELLGFSTYILQI